MNPIQSRPLSLACTALTVALAAPATAQDSRFADHGAVDAAIVAFTGAPMGTPGGARHPVDRRLRLAVCAQPLALAWHGRNAEMVRVECTGAQSWRIFMPVNPGGVNATQPSAEPVAVVERGQVISIVIAGRGFSIAQQGEALEEGAIGQWIRVRPDGHREPLRARIETPGRAVIPAG